MWNKFSKQIKKLKLYGYVICSLALLSSCSNGDTNETEINNVMLKSDIEKIETSAVGGTYKVAVTCNKEWFSYSKESWIHSEEANGLTEMIVTIDANSSANSREGTVHIASGKSDISIVVTQESAMQVSRTELYSSAKGDSQTLTVTVNRDWNVISNDSWIKVYKLDNTSFTVTADENTTQESRKGSITVISGDESVTIIVKQESQEESEYKAPDGYKLVWHDEFNSTTLGDDWTYELHPSRWVNSELQEYVKSDETCFLSEGTLKLRCLQNSDDKIQSARLNICRNTGWQYGYFEASIKMPAGKGTWPAFWMMPVNYVSWPADGEIDIMEYVGKDPHTIYSTIHCNKYNNTGTSIESGNVTVSTAETEFHKYALEWTEKYMTFMVDDQTILTYRNDGTGTDAWPFDAPFYIILNNAFGGTWGGASGVDYSCLPSTFEIDYVRVFQKQ